MVVDTSIILSIFLNEATAERCAAKLMAVQKSGEKLRMSTVSLTEALIRLRDKTGEEADVFLNRLLSSSIEFVPPDIRQSQIAAEARLKFPLNLGDCFVYALAVSVSEPIFTLDQDFRSCGHALADF